MEYYKDKILLPYRETVGVGANAETIEKKTYEELKDFLKSEASLKVYTNAHELIAIANLYNIKINIFTYGDGPVRWSQVCPDPMFASDAEIGKWFPDMALYYCYNTHYDLLVKEDSRIALVGLVAGKDLAEQSDVDKKVSDTAFDWKQVPIKKRKLRKELLLEEDEAKDENVKDLDEELTLLSGKQSGHRRTAPQEMPEVVSENVKKFQCEKCDKELESEGLFNAHMQSHHIPKPVFACEHCDDEFNLKHDLMVHVRDMHIKKHKSEEWNCDSCSFQASEPSELMNHLKATGHQPSKNIDKKKIFKDFKQCYTCRMEFDGFYNLMNHRKLVHPSNKKCKNFPGSCSFGNECWYVHEEAMEIDQPSDVHGIDSWNFKCNLCEEKIVERKDFMIHKKKKHGDTILNCEKYLKGKCVRSNEMCWFNHPSDDVQPEKSVFQSVPENPPPDKMEQVLQMINNLCAKVEKIEMKFQQQTE